MKRKLSYVAISTSHKPALMPQGDANAASTLSGQIRALFEQQEVA